MQSKDTEILEIQKNKMEELHRHTRQLKSLLQFMGDEILFLERLLNAYVFEPTTPNLFERLQDYRQRLEKMKSARNEVHKRITKYENELGGILDCRDSMCDSTYYQEHEKIKALTATCNEDFQDLKAEIFNYAGGILKKRKP